MTEINLDSLLTPISPEAPSGLSGFDNDPAFFDLERNIQGTPEQEFGGEIVQEAKDPKWSEIQDDALKLLARCHDLQVAVFLTRALVHTKGVNGLGLGLELIYGYVSSYWESVYPRLDPEDNHDPVQRMNILMSLSEYREIIAPLMEQPLCVSPNLGKYSYRDVLIAHGKITATKKDKDPSPNMKEIDAAFSDADDNALSEKKAAMEHALKYLTLLKTGLREKVDPDHVGLVPDFKELHEILTEMDALMFKQTKQQNKGQSPDPEHAPAGETEEPAKGPPPPTAPASTGSVTNRQDVIRLLDLICAYYEHNEPGSPVPLLLKRARQLVQKNFIEIIQDLAPDAAGKFKNLIVGADDHK